MAPVDPRPLFTAGEDPEEQRQMGNFDGLYQVAFDWLDEVRLRNAHLTLSVPSATDRTVGTCRMQD